MNTRRPQAFALDAPHDQPAPEDGPAPVEVVAEADVFAERDLADVPAATARAVRRGWSWGDTLAAAAGGFLSLALGLWAWSVVEGLMAANPWLGRAGLGLAALAALAVVVIALREFAALRRLDRVAELAISARAAAAADDRDGARTVTARLVGLYAADASSATQRAEVERASREIIDGRDLLAIAERALLAPRDRLARAAIASASKRVSVVTAISPRAIVDILFVLAQSIMLVRAIAQLYAGRPGTFGALKLGRRILWHLAVTGGVAISDSVIGQLMGHGLAARLSAKLGEGVLNGLLTARVGLAAIAVCRPMPFLGEPEPSLQDVAGALFQRRGDPENSAGSA